MNEQFKSQYVITNKDALVSAVELSIIDNEYINHI